MVGQPAANGGRGEQTGTVDSEKDGDPALDVGWGDAGAGGKGEGNDRDDDAVKEDVCENGHADGEEDEPVRGPIF